MLPGVQFLDKGYRIAAWKSGISEDISENTTPLWRRDYFMRLFLSSSTSSSLLSNLYQSESYFKNPFYNASLTFHNYN